MSTRFALLLLACAWLAVRPALAEEELKECIALSAADAAALRTVRVTTAIPQDDVQKMTLPLLRTHVVGPSTGHVGGLLGMVVAGIIADAVINSQIQRRVERATLAFPRLLDEVRDFDFRRHFWSRLAAAERDGRFRVLDITTFSGERGYVEQPASVRGEAVDALLDLHTEYALTADLRSFVMVTHVALQARADRRDLYRCRYYFITPPVTAGELEEAIAAWAADGGALYRAAAVIGMQQTLKMLRVDLTGEEAPRPSGPDVHVHEMRFTAGATLRVPIRAALVDREDGVVIARDARGFLRSGPEGEQFRPDAEMIAAAKRPPSGGGRRGPVRIDELFGMLDAAEPAAPAAPQVPHAAPSPARGEETAAGSMALDDLGGLLKE